MTGKYDTDLNGNSEIRNDMLATIANELAEANRLKRLELKFMDYISDFDGFFSAEQLEDQS